jgi:hypothetical protein
MNIDEIRCLLAQHHRFFSPVICMQFCLGLPVGLPAILWGQACPPTTYMSYYSKSTPKWMSARSPPQQPGARTKIGERWKHVLNMCVLWSG